MGDSTFDDFELWAEPDENDYRAVNKTQLTHLLMNHVDGLRPVQSPIEFTDIRQTVRWYLAFDITGRASRRRKFAQRKVAEQSGKDFSTVQGKVRDVYNTQDSQKSPQELFEEDLKSIEQAYQSYLDAQ